MKNKIHFTIYPKSIGRGMLSIVIKSTLHGKSVHISTGVHVFNDEWDDTDGLIINNPNANLLTSTFVKRSITLKLLNLIPI